MRALAALLLTAVLALQAFIDLELAFDLGSWHVNAPVADLLALALVPLAALRWRERAPLPGLAGYALFLLAGLLSLGAALEPGVAAHHLLRKPIFLYVAYGFALPLVARAAPAAAVAGGMLGGALLTAGVSLASSAGRIAAGDALWFHALEGLTPNHKTLAVALSAQLPLLLGLPRLLPGLPGWLERARLPAIFLLLAAVGASASKTAWITAAFGLACFWPRARPLAARPRLILPLLAAALGLALYAPLLLGSKAMLDAARSRHSLNVRAWEMFERNPIFGSGSGMNVVEEMVTFPHYRVNGVDAHGVIQKVASETGLVGLAGYLGFVVAMALALRARALAEGAGGAAQALLASFAALHLNLLLSTETLSPTHWIPLGLLWGLAHRPRAREAP